jgi:hypothetical protein
MYRFIFLFLITACCCSCFKSRSNLNYTVPLSNNNCNCKFYVEVYNVWFNTLRASYVTDSINFRMYAGTYNDENEIISFKCDRGRLLVEKDTKSQLLINDTITIGNKRVLSPTVSSSTKTSKRYYKLSDLISNHRFD